MIRSPAEAKSVVDKIRNLRLRTKVGAALAAEMKAAEQWCGR
jgi:hypothetical protein